MGGVSMRTIVDLVKPLPEAKWVVFYSLGEGADKGVYYDAHPIEHMSHHLTMLAYDMNDQPLSFGHGAPLRLRNEIELGFKQVKWIKGIEFVAALLRARKRLRRLQPRPRILRLPTIHLEPHEGGNAMKRWHLPTLKPSSDKRTAREPGADASRVPTAGAQKPRVLFSSPECRLIALDLDAGEELADHHVRERAVVQVRGSDTPTAADRQRSSPST